MNVRQLVRFGAVGIVQNAVNLGAFAGAHAAGVAYLAAAVLAAVVALAVSFVLHRQWTFARGSGAGLGGHVARYCVAFTTAVAAGVVLLTIQVETMSVPPVAAQAVAILLVAPASYLVQRAWVFR